LGGAWAGPPRVGPLSSSQQLFPNGKNKKRWVEAAPPPPGVQRKWGCPPRRGEPGGGPCFAVNHGPRSRGRDLVNRQNKGKLGVERMAPIHPLKKTYSLKNTTWY